MFFYCDISLHSKINRTKKEPRHSILEEFIKDPTKTHHFGFHTQFTKDMCLFLKDYSLPNLSEEKMNDFVYLLGCVISDTPIEVTIEGLLYTIVFKQPENKDMSGLWIVTPPFTLH